MMYATSWELTDKTVILSRKMQLLLFTGLLSIKFKQHWKKYSASWWIIYLLPCLKLQRIILELLFLNKVMDYWQIELGQLSLHGLKILNLPISKNVCYFCSRGKATRQYPSTHAQNCKLIYCDVWRPSITLEINFEKYYL